MCKKQKEYYDKLLSKCKKYIDSSVDASLREKYIWLNNRIKRSISKDDLLQEEYNKEKKEDGMNGFIEWLELVREKKKQMTELENDFGEIQDIDSEGDYSLIDCKKKRNEE